MDIDNSPDITLQHNGLDDLQCKALKHYADGEFIYLTELSRSEALNQATNHIGDTLLEFILKKISDVDGDVQEAIRMLYSAAEQLVNVANDLQLP